MDIKTFSTDYRSTSSQVEKDNLFPHTASRETLLSTTQSCQCVSESTVQQQVTTDWIIDNNVAAAKLVRPLDPDFNPTELWQHTNHRGWRSPPRHVHSFQLLTAIRCEEETQWRFTTWQGVEFKNTVINKIEKESVQSSVLQTQHISEHH